MKKIICLLTICCFVSSAFGSLTFDDINFWAGSGSNSTGLIVHWSLPEVFNNSSVAAPIQDVCYAWGYKFDGQATAADMMTAIAAADSQLYLLTEGYGGNLGSAVNGIGYDFNNDGAFSLSNGNATFTAGDFTNGILNTSEDPDTLALSGNEDLYWGGWMGPNWELWHEQGGNGEFSSAPDRGTDAYWSGSFFSGSHGEWDFAEVGISGLNIENGSWVGWSVAAGGLDMMDFGCSGTTAWLNNKQAPCEAVAVVPEPTTIALLGLGALALRRKK